MTRKYPYEYDSYGTAWREAFMKKERKGIVGMIFHCPDCGHELYVKISDCYKKEAKK